MTHKPNTHSFQDLPPRGGYPSVNTVKGIRPRGPPGWLIWATVVASSCYGFFSLGRSNERRRMALKERREARMAILPFLQAEKDRELAARVKESLEHEAEVMKHTEGWTVGQSVYSNRWSYPRL